MNALSLPITSPDLSFIPHGYVLNLQQFDALLKESEKDGSIKIEGTNITVRENKILSYENNRYTF